MKIFLDLLWEYCCLIFGSLIVSFLFWYYKPESVIKACEFLPIIVFLTISLMIISKIAINLHHQLKDPRCILPKLIEIRKDATLLFEDCQIFTTDSIVAIYCKDKFEDFVTCGHLYRRQIDTNYLQVRLLNQDEDIKKQINNKQKKIYLVPTVPKSCIEEMIETGVEGAIAERSIKND